MTRVLICGGREFNDSVFMFNKLLELDDYFKFSKIITGGAFGADSLAIEYAVQNRIPRIVYKANWKAHGKAAGMIRNKYMLEQGKPDLVIAFDGGSGTKNMIKIALQAGVKVIECSKNKLEDYFE